MADTSENQVVPTEEESRRDFLLHATVATGAVGVAVATWPLINSMNPAADTLALSSVEVSLSSLQEGQAITISWRGKPVFARYRTPAEIEEARSERWQDMPDPQPDEERVQDERYLIVVGVCTHLGCVPLGQKTTEPRGDYGGYFCPCHGSHYDKSARIRKGPAPTNLEVPEYTFLSETNVRIG
ncbi:MAG: ubiquinol-cytochrome c reductase iron-sulfur subunit [Rhodospirillaceae bacterium]